MNGTQVFRLAIADLRRDWALSLCQAFSLAAVLTPLLVLAGLHQGVLGQLQTDLRNNPAMREIMPRVTGTNRFTEAWIVETRARRDVSFIVGDARFTAAAVAAKSEGDPNDAHVIATLVPTAANDPFRPSPTAPWAGGSDTVVLSDQAAREIGTSQGKHLVLHIPRRRDGLDDGRDLSVTVAAVLPPGRMENRRVILASERLVWWVQAFRDGFAISDLGWPGGALPAGPPYYERFRLYARQIDDVAPVVDWLKTLGIEPVSRIEDIVPVQALDRGLSVVLLIVAAFAASGLAVAVAATQWSGVERKRHELALLALIGYRGGFLIRMALLEAVILAFAGILVSLVLFQGAATSIDAVFSHYQRLSTPACQLSPSQMMVALSLTAALTIAASAVAAWQISRIEPAGMLREQ